MQEQRKQSSNYLRILKTHCVFLAFPGFYSGCHGQELRTTAKNKHEFLFDLYNLKIMVVLFCLGLCKVFMVRAWLFIVVLVFFFILFRHMTP